MRSETILDNYIKMNKIILLKNVNQILKSFGITLLVSIIQHLNTNNIFSTKQFGWNLQVR